MEIISFEDAYAWAKQITNSKGTVEKNPNLLLGNGFSISFDLNKFSYGALLEVASQKILQLPLSRKIFENQDSNDFEVVINKLEQAANTLEIADPRKYQNDIINFRIEAQEVKKILAESIAELHSDRPFEVLDQEYINCRNFLRKFENYYTTNYDYLLYWALMQDSQGENDPEIKHRDGFYNRHDDEPYVIWDRLHHSGENIFYLHGALHLFKDSVDGSIRKITYKRTKKALIDQTRKFLGENNYPLVVAEGSAETKLKRVDESAFLSHAHRSLAGRGGGLVIYGLSLSPNDQHIAYAIASSNIQKLAVSIFGDINDEINQQLINSLDNIITIRNNIIDKNRNKKQITYKLFDANSAHIWR